MQERYSDKYNWLVKSKSPYLNQHETNPVNWLEWSDEAFEKAKQEDKPVFVSIGYSTCHWCHVMAHESFEDEEVATLLNERFISIKVDREERPDVDAIYMKVCQGLTGQGGWPLNVFLTPDQKPFYAGTYFPKESRFQMPGFTDVIQQLYDQYTNNHEKIAGIGEKITRSFQQQITHSGNLSEETVHECYLQLEQNFDPTYGGFGSEPKFPAPHQLMFLLRYYHWTKKERALTMVEKTLDGMADGGIYDHIGFGFARYSVDEKWLVPHFEKMLYDNAMLAMAYTESYQVTKRDRYRTVAEEILSYVQRDMLATNGGFFSAEDADSEGVEGKFYVWDPEEVIDVLGAETGAMFCEVYDISKAGNFEGKNIPNLIHMNLENVAKEHGMSGTDLKNQLEQARKKLFDHRENRIHPHKDDKILTSWNGLMIAAFAKAGRVFQSATFSEIAENALDFIEDKLNENGRFMARYREGEVKNKGYIDDYANLLWATIELYETSLDPRFLQRANTLVDDMNQLFWDDESGGFYLYGDDAEQLISRPKELYDGAIPSGNSVAAVQMLRLAKLTGNISLEEKVSAMFSAFAGDVSHYSAGYCYFLQSLLMTQMSDKEVVLLGATSDQEYHHGVQFIQQAFLPDVTFLASDRPENLANVSPFTEDFKRIEGKTTVYLCENFTCQRPTTDVESVISQFVL